MYIWPVHIDQQIRCAQTTSTSDFQSEVGEVFGEIGGCSSFFCWGKSSEAFSTKTPPQISPSNFTTRFWVVAGPTSNFTTLTKFGRSLRAQSWKKTMSLENFHLSGNVQSWPSEFPTNKRASVSGSLEVFLLACKFQSRRRSWELFQSLGP